MHSNGGSLEGPLLWPVVLLRWVSPRIVLFQRLSNVIGSRRQPSRDRSRQLATIVHPGQGKRLVKRQLAAAVRTITRHPFSSHRGEMWISLWRQARCSLENGPKHCPIGQKFAATNLSHETTICRKFLSYPAKKCSSHYLPYNNSLQPILLCFLP